MRDGVDPDACFGNPSSAHIFASQPARLLAEAHAMVATAICASEPGEIVLCGPGSESISHILTGVAFAHMEADMGYSDIRDGLEHGADGPAGMAAGQGGGEASSESGTGMTSTSTSRVCGGTRARPHIVSSAIEHPAVLETLKWLRAKGFATYTLVQPSPRGVVAAADVVRAITPQTVLVSVMLANNETGAIQPVAEIVRAVRAAFPERRILFHTDAAQAFGKIPVSVRDLDVDFMTIVGHKFYAPKGCSATFIRKGVVIDSLIHGAGQEGGRRAGTENVAIAYALGSAAKLAAESFGAATPMDQHLAHLRDELASLLLREADAAGIPKPVIHGPLSVRDFAAAGSTLTAGEARAAEAWKGLPNTLSIAFPGAFSADVIYRLRKTVAISAGAACHSSAPGDPTQAHISHVLQAMGVPKDLAVCTLRLSVGRFTQRDELPVAARAIVAAVVHARSAPSAAILARMNALTPAAVAAGAAGALASAAAAATTTKHAPELLPRTQPVYLSDTYAFSYEARVIGVASVNADGMMVVCAPVGAEPRQVGASVAGFKHAVLLSATVAHPQGGGQPADSGYIAIHRSDADGGPCGFEFRMVRAAPGGYVLHFGDFVAHEDSPAAAADRVTTGGTPIFPSVQIDPGSVVQANASVAINARQRLYAARLHSAGHLLDAAMRRVLTALQASGANIAPLKPGKGYHFFDGPFVEYEGDIPAGLRDRVVALLNEHCAALVAAAKPTVTHSILPTPAELTRVGVAPEDVSHLSPEEPVRIVAVAGEDNVCPCGGTHVGASDDIGSVTVTKLTVKKGKTKVSYCIPAPPAAGEA